MGGSAERRRPSKRGRPDPGMQAAGMPTGQAEAARTGRGTAAPRRTRRAQAVFHRPGRGTRAYAARRGRQAGNRTLMQANNHKFKYQAILTLNSKQSCNQDIRQSSADAAHGQALARASSRWRTAARAAALRKWGHPMAGRPPSGSGRKPARAAILHGRPRKGIKAGPSEPVQRCAPTGLPKMPAQRRHGRRPSAAVGWYRLMIRRGAAEKTLA